jgi:hypothetical protein
MAALRKLSLDIDFIVVTTGVGNLKFSTEVNRNRTCALYGKYCLYVKNDEHGNNVNISDCPTDITYTESVYK